ncbi:diguanylate cyclase [Marivirga tractuosa]|uniref:GafA GAF domain-containing protein n=1 Tax=Marivirga tractuosa (strain ATCC 23168 / DSM 4126 / NBRC 15989 / NCIMB 1408 / VKM B-1430 / H-43) TaxID=643867 RepID=E4TNP4_MARTH|nr:GAF domain-containing protein [Marivirga tractuosa]ADR21481.1 GafA; GAF domain-containing protein [Marivirga tractuosa DSM 4126]BDD14065.1 diguanylate cyclase [Marivirga tractuosa]
MSESLLIDVNASKEEKYKALIPQINALVDGEEDVVANLANVTAALKEAFGYFWIGFYVVKNGELVLGPFQGPIACTRIQKGKGVCGSVWADAKTIVVPDVEAFPGHIACSSASKSEIVVPAFKNNEVALVLDIDSDELNTFDEIDQKYLEELMKTVSEFL